MRKLFAFAVGVFAVGLLVWSSANALADCGKMIIVHHHWHAPPPPPPPPKVYCPPHHWVPKQRPWVVPQYGQQQQYQEQQAKAVASASGNVLNLNLNVQGQGKIKPPGPGPGWEPQPQPEPNPDSYPGGYDEGYVELPPAFEPPTDLPPGGVAAYGDKAFLEGEQQAVIAWNGKTDDSGEEVLILTTNELSNTGQPMAMLSVLPLPGAPVSIERANAKVFVQTKILLDKKISEKTNRDAGAVGYGAIMTQKIGAHNIFVWEMEDISKFKDEVSAYVAAKYDNKATALITDKTLSVIKSYHDRGYRYFAFDLTLVDNKVSTKEAIAYRFKSKFAYYPLAVSAIGGTGHGLIDLVVMTPGQLNLMGAFTPGKEEAKPVVKGNTFVEFTMKEVGDLDPSLAAVFKGSGLNSVLVRNFLIEAEDIGQFKSDFVAVPVP